MKRLAIVALLGLMPSMGQQDQTIVAVRKRAAVVCVAPTTDHRYAINEPTTTCNGGSACTNGAGIDFVTDLVQTDRDNRARQTVSGQRPIYTTGAINGLPAAAFTSTNSQFLDMANGGGWLGSGGAVTAITVWMVIKPTNGAWILSSQSGTAGSFMYSFTASPGHQHADSKNRTILGSGTATLSSSTWYTLAVTYNFSTGALAFYKPDAKKRPSHLRAVPSPMYR